METTFFGGKINFEEKVKTLTDAAQIEIGKPSLTINPMSWVNRACHYVKNSSCKEKALLTGDFLIGGASIAWLGNNTQWAHIGVNLAAFLWMTTRLAASHPTEALEKLQEAQIDLIKSLPYNPGDGNFSIRNIVVYNPETKQKEIIPIEKFEGFSPDEVRMSIIKYFLEKGDVEISVGISAEEHRVIKFDRMRTVWNIPGKPDVSKMFNSYLASSLTALGSSAAYLAAYACRPKPSTDPTGPEITEVTTPSPTNTTTEFLSPTSTTSSPSGFLSPREDFPDSDFNDINQSAIDVNNTDNQSLMWDLHAAMVSTVAPVVGSMLEGILENKSTVSVDTEARMLLSNPFYGPNVLYWSDEFRKSDGDGWAYIEPIEMLAVGALVFTTTFLPAIIESKFLGRKQDEFIKDTQELLEFLKEKNDEDLSAEGKKIFFSQIGPKFHEYIIKYSSVMYKNSPFERDELQREYENLFRIDMSLAKWHQDLQNVKHEAGQMQTPKPSDESTRAPNPYFKKVLIDCCSRLEEMSKKEFYHTRAIFEFEKKERIRFDKDDMINELNKIFKLGFFKDKSIMDGINVDSDNILEQVRVDLFFDKDDGSLLDNNLKVLLKGEKDRKGLGELSYLELYKLYYAVVQSLPDDVHKYNGPNLEELSAIKKGIMGPGSDKVKIIPSAEVLNLWKEAFQDALVEKDNILLEAEKFHNAGSGVEQNSPQVTTFGLREQDRRSELEQQAARNAGYTQIGGSSSSRGPNH